VAQNRIIVPGLIKCLDRNTITIGNLVCQLELRDLAHGDAVAMFNSADQQILGASDFMWQLVRLRALASPLIPGIKHLLNYTAPDDHFQYVPAEVRADSDSELKPQQCTHPRLLNGLC
jgi:hypothetical protein